jgi:CubicO group peptidase (beta-lactamase class C family)
VGLCGQRLRRIDAILQQHVDQGGVSGAVAAFARHGKLIHHRAYGFADPVTGAMMTEDALFQTYSSTKVVTAVALLMLIEEGAFRLEDPISRYLPEFTSAKVAIRKDPGGVFKVWTPEESPPNFDLADAIRDITVRDLMTHTAGLMTSDPGRV